MIKQIYIENLIGEPPHILTPFNYINYVDESKNTYTLTYTSPSLIKHTCTLDDSTDTHISELKFTNNPLKCWVDMWIEQTSGLSIDPLIQKMNLSNNHTMELVSIVQPRQYLSTLNLRNNSRLKYIQLSGCEALTSLDISTCTSIDKIVFGWTSNLEEISARNCNLSESCLESLLGGYNPVKPGATIDLRGNFINWNNRRILSKIRLLLSNNIAVLWDENPPTHLIPIYYYKKPWQI